MTDVATCLLGQVVPTRLAGGMDRCEHCSHDWHGLRCRHEAVVRRGWALERETCACPHADLGAPGLH